MNENNITTTNRQAILDLIDAAEETTDISQLQEKTQHISANDDRTSISKNYTDGETFDITGMVDVTFNPFINSSDSITFIGSELSVSPGEVNIYSSNDDIGDSSTLSISVAQIEFQSLNVDDFQGIIISPSIIQINGAIGGSQKTLINIKGLPTSSAGLSAGTLYNSGGFLKIA